MCFVAMPAVLMWGMLCVDLATGIWLWVATKLEYPVSATHSVIGAIVGMTLAAVGSACVVWTQEVPVFPYFRGITAIVVSWIFSPVLSGIIAAFLFGVSRAVVLRSPHAVERALWAMPVLVFCTVTLVLFFLIVKTTNNVNGSFDPGKKNLGEACAICFSIGTAAALLVIPFFGRVRASIANLPDVEEEVTVESETKRVQLLVAEQASKPPKTGLNKWLAEHLDLDINDIVVANATVLAVHQTAEKFSPKAEGVFRFMQVITACILSFSHGANDVANSMGPFAASYVIYKYKGRIALKNKLDDDIYWILAIGGAGLVCGLATFGYKIIYAMGVKVTKLTPSRGFGVELGAVFVILLGSRLGIPLSTTHCTVGGIVGVSLVEGKVAATNFPIVLKFFAGWAATMVITGALAAAMFSIGYANIAWDPTQQLVAGWAIRAHT